MIGLNKDKSIYYVYLDRTNDGRIFYVGKGQATRVRTKERKNIIWKRISKKYGWSIENREVILGTKDNNYALEIEIYYIALYKTFQRASEIRDGWGANMTAGGEGTPGFEGGMKGKHHTDKTKKLISEGHKGEKHWMFGIGMPQYAKDTMSDGRRKGDKNNGAKLKDKQIIEIVNRYINDENCTYKDLIKEYGISRACISRIFRGTHWKHLGLITDEIKLLIAQKSKKNQSIVNNNHFGGHHHSKKMKKDLSERFNGENSVRAKFTWEVVNELREKWLTGIYTQKLLSEQYKIERTTLGAILRGKTWKDPNYNYEYDKRTQTLTKEMVLEIRSKWNTKQYSIADLAREFRLTHSCVSHIIHNRSWKNV